MHLRQILRLPSNQGVVGREKGSAKQKRGARRRTATRGKKIAMGSCLQIDGSPLFSSPLRGGAAFTFIRRSCCVSGALCAGFSPVCPSVSHIPFRHTSCRAQVETCPWVSRAPRSRSLEIAANPIIKQPLYWYCSRVVYITPNSQCPI